MTANPRCFRRRSWQRLDKEASVKIAVQCLQAIFGSDDTIMFRPIKTWTEDGQKKSKTDYKNTCHRRADVVTLRRTVLQLLGVLCRKSHKRLF